MGKSLCCGCSSILSEQLGTGGLGYGRNEGLQELMEEIGNVERMLKAMTKSLENKHLTP